MSPDTVLINTPNFNFCLSSSKTQVHQFKKDIPKSSIQYSIMTAKKKNQLSMQGSNMHSKTQVLTHHYQRFSSAQYLIQMQVQVQHK